MNEDVRSPAAGWVVTAAVLLVATMWARWFTASLAGFDIPEHKTAWQWFGVFDWYLVAVALLAVATAGLARRRAPAVREAALLTCGLSALAFLYIAYRILSPPDDARPGFVTEVSVSAGPWLALVALGVLGLAAATLGGVSPRSRERASEPSS